MITNLIRCARERAYRYGADAVILEKEADKLAPGPLPETIDDCTENQLRAVLLAMQAHDLRRRYWRELSTCYQLMGMPMPAFEALG